jgi:arylsulfatase A-like enzyme
MKMNILFITTDQQHWRTMGYLNPEVRTPNLDRLVSYGTSLERAYTVNPTCTPTRSSWITGLYPSQHGAYSLGTKLMENIPTVGDIFHKHGYRTALVGKAHFQPLLGTENYPSLESYPILHDLDFWRGFHGPFYGFDHVELARNHTDESHVGQHYALWLEEKGYKDWRQHFLPSPTWVEEPAGYPSSDRQRIKPGEAWDIPEQYHYNAWIAERTSALMDSYQHNGEPFFLWASFLDPHPQYMVPEPYASMYDPSQVTVPEHIPGEFNDKPPYFQRSQQEHPDFSDFQEEGGSAIHGAHSHLASREVKAKRIATMYGMVTMLDVYIGKILDHLQALGLQENTLVCFTTDHGDLWGQHGLTAKCIHHYEDLLRVPLVVSLPGKVPEGVISQSLQSTVDLGPTFLSVAGLPVPRTMTGMDEKGVWFGEKEMLRSHVIVENQHQPTMMNMRSYIDQRYKLTVHFNQDYGELYDLQSDPGEYVNLWHSPAHQELKSRLLLEFIYAEMAKAPLPMPRIYPA